MPVAETAGVTEVAALDGGGWDELGGALPVIGPADAPLLVTARAGEGTRRAARRRLAAAEPRRSARADNAALGLALAGGARRPVAFLETVHGYGVSRGFGGLPAQRQVDAARARADRAGRGLGRRAAASARPRTRTSPLPPPRVEYVDALAAALVRAKPDKEERS